LPAAQRAPEARHRPAPTALGPLLPARPDDAGRYPRRRGARARSLTRRSGRMTWNSWT
jgi:hypothetical protein